MLNEYYKNKKNRFGYVETIKQYSGDNKNVIVNLHKNNHMNFHQHDFYEINYVAEGACDNLLEDGTLSMQKGDYVILNPNAMHSLFVDSASKAYNFIVSVELVHGLFKRIRRCENDAFYRFANGAATKNAPSYLFVRGTESNDDIISRLISLKPALNSSLVAESLICELMLECASDEKCATLSETTVDGTNTLKNILARMQTDYPSFTLDSASVEFGYSKAHICKLFRKHYCTTFSKKLNEIRILHAKKMLTDTSMTIAEISHEVGIESVEYFHRLFRSLCGETPSDYRSRMS